MSRLRRRTILVHHCFNPLFPDRVFNPALCICRKMITLRDAKEHVQQDMALFCFTKGQERGAVPLSEHEEGYSEVVMTAKGHEGPAHTISKGDIERAYVDGQHKAVAHIEAFGESMRETWTTLIKPHDTLTAYRV